MPVLHDPGVRKSIEERLKSLTADTRPRWGKMSVDQMLWHVNESLGIPLGQTALSPWRLPVPRSVLKFAVLKLPWSRGAPTNPALVARAQHDFGTERTRCLQLIDEIVRRPIDASWPVHPIFGRMSGRELSQLHAKHLDHHLRQFGA